MLYMLTELRVHQLLKELLNVGNERSDSELIIQIFAPNVAEFLLFLQSLKRDLGQTSPKLANKAEEREVGNVGERSSDSCGA
jgi:hypothetical protein